MRVRRTGNRPDYRRVIEELKLLSSLHEFDPRVIGTPPLGLDTYTSDIDIACSTGDLARFEEVARESFGALEAFQCSRLTAQDQASVAARFYATGWDVEVFCQTIPTDQQWGVRHFRIEQRLLNLEPGLRPLIRRLKENGLKTEPAFAQVLKLPGDPFRALLDLERRSDDQIRRLLAGRK